MPLPNVKVNINNVSIDYFLRGVEASKPSASAKQSSVALAKEDAKTKEDKTTHGAGKMMAQLDVLLVKAAKDSTKSLDGKQVKKSFGQLVKDA